MTNQENSKLRQLVKEGLSFSEIRKMVNCSDWLIKLYIKTLRG